MVRRIIKIDENKCDGCGICANACHEGAIGIINGKAKLLREDFCDGLGDCLPACPQGAITFEEREAPEYNHEAVMQAKQQREKGATLECGCPGTHVRSIRREITPQTQRAVKSDTVSELGHWPIQIRLVPEKASFLENAKLLVAADCTAFARADFHERFIKDRVVLIGCPKLDDINYADKLTRVLANNNIRSVTVVRMEVPCCGGIVNAVTTALKNSGKLIPWRVITVGTDGSITES